MNRNFIGAMGMFPAAVLLMFGCLCGAAAEKTARPNFVLILTDDQGWSQLSESLHPKVPQARSSYLKTPNMDRLGREGIRFTSGYSPAPLCTPTRRSILCGATAARCGSEFRSSWIPAQHLTIPRALKRVDPRYRCAHFGKWGENMISTPQQCGYDAGDGMTGNVTGGMPKSLNPDVSNANHRNTAPFYTNQKDPKLTGHVTDRTIGFMRESVRAGRPFFVQASYYAVHLSIVCREKTLKEYKAKGEPDRGYTQAWAAMLEELDTAVGRLVDSLNELGVADNTYVVFLSDNGGRGTLPAGSRQRLAPNYPLTGAKHSLYEGGIRVPFMVRGPGIKAGSVCHTPVAGYDLLATFYELAGGAEKLPAEIDGVSIRPLLTDPEKGRISRDAGGLIFHRPRRRFSAIRQDDYKLMVFWRRDGKIRSRELYRFNHDPREENRNVADQEPARADTMQKLLLDYLAKVGAETPNPPRRRSKNQ